MTQHMLSSSWSATDSGCLEMLDKVTREKPVRLYVYSITLHTPTAAVIFFFLTNGTFFQ